MTNSPENKDYANSVPYYMPERKKNHYTLTHAIFALLTLIIGSLWYRWVFAYRIDGIFGSFSALPVTVFTLVFFAFAVSYFKLRRIVIGKDAFIFMCACLVFSLRYALYPRDSYSFIALLSVIVLHVCVLLFLYCVGSEKAIDHIVGSICKAVFYTPFCRFHCIFASFVALFKIRKRNDEAKEKNRDMFYKVLLVIFGIFISIPIMINVLVLFSSDGFFADFMQGISNFLSNIRIDFRIRRYFNIITVLVSMYIFGAMYDADRRASHKETAEPAADTSIMPQIMSTTIMICFLSVYLLFFIAQIGGFSHMLAGTLPENTTYAEFARSGFFELCTVACISGGVLYITEMLEIKTLIGKSATISKSLMIIFNILLIFTAAFKMIMYISAYGYTPKRFYTLWFMLLLTVLFAMAYIKLRKRQFWLSRYSVYVTLIFLTVLFLVDFEGLSESLNMKYFFSSINQT